MVARSAGITGTPYPHSMADRAAHTATTTPTATTEAALSPSTARVPGVGTVAATNPEVATASAETTSTPPTPRTEGRGVLTVTTTKTAHRVVALSPWTALAPLAPTGLAVVMWAVVWDGPTSTKTGGDPCKPSQTNAAESTKSPETLLTTELGVLTPTITCSAPLLVVLSP